MPDGGGPAGLAGPSEWPVVLVSMPFMDPYRPSIQLGLLKSLAASHGFPVRTLHAYLNFAAAIGVADYELLAQHRGSMVGEWLFSLDAFRDAAPDRDSDKLAELSSSLSYLAVPPAELRSKLAKIRQVDIPAYLTSLVEAFPWQEVAVVGFSSTFQQNTASLALARRLKERHPHIFTVFGGANFDGDMGPEFVRAFDCIDAAIIGEADESFPQLLRALADGKDLTSIPGVALRVEGRVSLTAPRPPKLQLDDLPAPDYEDYFEQAESLGILSRAGRGKVWLPIETARGCWWGEKHHCTFCGLNATSMQFRSKSPDRVLAELEEQSRRYRNFNFEAVDNVLELAYLKNLFPRLIEIEAGYEFFYEVKANLSREQLKLMAEAGVAHIQPGLESLSSNVLRLMRKGVRAAQNVNLLRWSLYYGIGVSWNLLWGFPGEREQDYVDQASVIPHLVHLPAPEAASRIWLERFSPLFTEQDARGLRNKAPERSYQYVYPADVDLEKVAYFFDYETEGSVPDAAYTAVQSAVAAWSDARQADKPPMLTHWSAPHFVQICDERHQGQDGTYAFEDTLADLYMACSNRPTTAAAVRRKLGLRLPEEDIREVFQEFQRRGLMFIDGDFALALSLPAVKSR
jgi:ribosomal peptide maturation radical SAM protein 1